MKLKRLIVFFIIYMPQTFVFGQHDFSANWNFYMTDEIVVDNPFLGSFTIKNEGLTTINAGDTLWYGYQIDGLGYDLALTPLLASGQVLDADFLPGDELEITNTFDWPLWGSGIMVDICATIYGPSYDSYSVELFMGDTNISNNMDCLSAILPTYELSTEEQGANHIFKVYNDLSDLIIFHDQNTTFENVAISVSSLSGQCLTHQLQPLNSGINRISLPALTNGIYIVTIHSGTTSSAYKISF